MTSTPQRTDGAGGLELHALLPGILRDDDAAVPSGRSRRSARDWIVDVGCFVLAVGIGLAAYDNAMQNEPPEVVAMLDLIVGALGWVALWWRRRWPVEMAIATSLLSIVVSSIAGASLIAVFTVAVHRRIAISAAVAAFHAACGLTFYVVYPDPTTSWRMSAVLTILLVAAVTSWGMFVRARRQLVLSLRERARQAESEATLREDRARHLERERIAREMHDVLAHRLSLLSVHAGALDYRPDMPAEDVARAASVIRASAHQALQDLREVIGVLRAPSDDDPDRPQPTLDDIDGLVSESQQAGMRVTLVDQRADHAQPPPAVARCAYRVVQEGLTNVRKHADGVGVRVTMQGGPGDGLDIDVINRAPVAGWLHDEIPGAGTGLVGLRERVGLSGGRLDYGPTPDGDFRLHAWLPWPA
ncbi:histidine kinase [Haloactinopolyspora sp.]|uniref:sensor histidine kinase n=1 Tax=Haloactinopolyspora sp. TaxID=1966353 RepID=UPI002615E962|nr:histidine kinase [Haloactinopolyspora sp.]